MLGHACRGSIESNFSQFTSRSSIEQESNLALNFVLTRPLNLEHGHRAMSHYYHDQHRQNKNTML